MQKKVTPRNTQGFREHAFFAQVSDRASERTVPPREGSNRKEDLNIIAFSATEPRVTRHRATDDTEYGADDKWPISIFLFEGDSLAETLAKKAKDLQIGNWIYARGSIVPGQRNGLPYIQFRLTELENYGNTPPPDMETM